MGAVEETKSSVSETLEQQLSVLINSNDTVATAVRSALILAESVVLRTPWRDDAGQPRDGVFIINDAVDRVVALRERVVPTPKATEVPTDGQ